MAHIKTISKLFFIFIFTHLQLTASTLIIINNSQSTIFVSDGIQIGTILTPSQQYIVQDTNLITLFFYQAEHIQTPQTFKLTYRLRELTTSNQPTTIAYTNITSKALHALFPGRFEIIPQTRLQFQQEHGAQLNTDKQQTAWAKNNQPKVTNSPSQQVAHSTPSEPTQAVVDALISQFSALQQKQQSVDTTHLKPTRKPPTAPQVRNKK